MWEAGSDHAAIISLIAKRAIKALAKTKRQNRTEMIMALSVARSVLFNFFKFYIAAKIIRNPLLNI